MVKVTRFLLGLVLIYLAYDIQVLNKIPENYFYVLLILLGVLITGSKYIKDKSHKWPTSKRDLSEKSGHLIGIFLLVSGALYSVGVLQDFISQFIAFALLLIGIFYGFYAIHKRRGQLAPVSLASARVQ